MRRIQIYVPGINTWPGDSKNWDGRAVTHTHCYTDFRAEKVEYWCSFVSRALGQKERARKLFNTLEYYDDYDQRVVVGHSNGGDVILTMMQDYPCFQRIDALHLVCAATEGDFEKNGLNQLLVDNKVGTVAVYMAGNDAMLKLAQSWPAHWLGYGAIGRTGPFNINPSVRMRVQVIKGCPWNAYGHSSCWADSEFSLTMEHFLKPLVV